MARPFIPTSIAECSAEWLTSVLRERGVLASARVTRVDAEPLGEGEGFMGAVARLHLGYDCSDAKAPATLIAKVPTLNRGMKIEAEVLGLYEREILFYEEFAPLLPDPAPVCFYTAMDPNPGTPESQLRLQRFLDRAPRWLIRLMMPAGRFLVRLSRRRYVMLLEDLAPARVGDHLSGGTASEIKAMLRHLARMHAHFWNSPAVDARYWIPPLDTTPKPLLMMYEDALPVFEELYGDQVSGHFKKLQQWLVENSVDLVTRFQSAPFTLLHGDFRLDNVCFPDPEDADPARVILFDWQIPVQGPGAYDLAYFLSATLEREVSEEHEEGLLHLYHDELLRGGVRDYGFDALRQDYRRALLMMVQRTTSALAGVETTNDRGRDLFLAWADRLDARVQGMDADALSILTTTDPFRGNAMSRHRAGTL